MIRPGTAPPILKWALQQGLVRLALHHAAHTGDPLAPLLLHPESASDSTVWPVYDRMRDRGQMVQGPHMLLAVSHAANRTVLRTDAFGVSENMAAYPSPVARLIMWSRDPGSRRVSEPPSLSALDPPHHTRVRRMVSKVFTPRAVNALLPRIEEISIELLDDMRRRRVVDLVPAYASQLPIIIIGEILGVPPRDLPVLAAHGLIASKTLELGLRWSDYRGVDQRMRRFNAWLADHIRRLERQPGNDLLSQLIQVRDEGDRLAPSEIHSLAALLLGAGYVTTTTAITSGVRMLLAEPDQLARLDDRPDSWINAVDEIVRLDSPVHLTARTSTRDTTIADFPIPAGTRVGVMIGAANRDPGVFADPHVFDVHRSNARDHLGFGGGPHYCLGANLARSEAAIGLKNLFRLYPELSLSGPPIRRRQFVLPGWDAMHVRTGPVAVVTDSEAP